MCYNVVACSSTVDGVLHPEAIASVVYMFYPNIFLVVGVIHPI